MGFVSLCNQCGVENVWKQSTPSSVFKDPDGSCLVLIVAVPAIFHALYSVHVKQKTLVVEGLSDVFLNGSFGW